MLAKQQQQQQEEEQQQQGQPQSQIGQILMRDQRRGGHLGVPSPSATLLQQMALEQSGSGSVRGGVGGFDTLRLKLDSVRLSVQGAHVAAHRTLKSDGQCDPYVTVRVVPTQAMGQGRRGAASPDAGGSPALKAKTKTQKRTLFPL